MFQIEESNAGIAKATARLDDEDMGHFSSQKSVKINRTGYKVKTANLFLFLRIVIGCFLY